MAKQLLPLKIRLLETNVTQRALAEQIGLSETTMSLVCTGQFRPSARLKEKIAQALNCPTHELFFT